MVFYWKIGEKRKTKNNFDAWNPYNDGQNGTYNK